MCVCVCVNMYFIYIIFFFVYQLYSGPGAGRASSGGPDEQSRRGAAAPSAGRPAGGRQGGQERRSRPAPPAVSQAAPPQPDQNAGSGVTWVGCEDEEHHGGAKWWISLRGPDVIPGHFHLNPALIFIFFFFCTFLLWMTRFIISSFNSFMEEQTTLLRGKLLTLNSNKMLKKEMGKKWGNWKFLNKYDLKQTEVFM